MDKYFFIPFTAARRLALVGVMTAGFALGISAAQAQQYSAAARNALDLLGARAVVPGGQDVAFRQVQFLFKAGRSPDSDWGHLQADAGKLRHLIGSEGDQGLNNNGLQTTQWEVADNSQPGFAGIPNGRLELGGTNWEIEFAMSAETKPTLLIP